MLSFVVGLISDLLENVIAVSEAVKWQTVSGRKTVWGNMQVTYPTYDEFNLIDLILIVETLPTSCSSCWSEPH